MKRNKALLCGLFVGLINAPFAACSPKKVSNRYEDSKIYRDDDSTGSVKVQEKKTKMPFDTGAVLIPKRVGSSTTQ